MVNGDTVSEAYLQYLHKYLDDWSFATSVKVNYPIVEGNVNIEKNIDQAFREHTFPDGKTGEEWISDRIDTIFNEARTYNKRLHQNGQYDYAIKSLKAYNVGKYPKWNANRFILTLFQSVLGQDLRKERNPEPPCLINISLHPVKGKLSLISTFRAQYVDTKAYGNMISLIMLQKQLCDETKFVPGTFHNVVYKPIRKYGKRHLKTLFEKISRVG